MYAESFPSKLKAARDQTGLSQRDVAKELNISQPTITSYETGRTQPDIETTQKEVPFCLVDTFSQQVALSVYPIP